MFGEIISIWIGSTSKKLLYMYLQTFCQNLLLKVVVTINLNCYFQSFHETVTNVRYVTLVFDNSNNTFLVL